MARIRTIKPEMSTHELLFELERELKINVRFAWAMLPGHCDREGRFKWRPLSLKAGILPYDLCDFSRVLDAWLTRGMLVRYRVGHEWYGWVPTFRLHQNINPREQASVLPSLEEAEEVEDYRNHQHPDALSTRANLDDDASSTGQLHAAGEGRGREGKGREGKETSTRQLRAADSTLNGHPVDPKPHEADPQAPLHDSLPADAWTEWLKHRRRKKWPVDQTTLTKQLNVLKQFDTDTQRRMIDNSINAGWQGIFEPKGQNTRKAIATPRKSADEMEDAVIERAIREGRSNEELLRMEDLALAPNLEKRITEKRKELGNVEH